MSHFNPPTTLLELSNYYNFKAEKNALVIESSTTSFKIRIKYKTFETCTLIITEDFPTL